jgi:predicted ATPase with chaperone activity
VIAALHSFGCDVADQKLVIHLSPPERKKQSPMFDLTMAIGILQAKEKLKGPISADIDFFGSLSLDGMIQPVDGMLPAILAAKKLGFKQVYLPYDSYSSSLSFTKLRLCICSNVRRSVATFTRTASLFSIFPSSSHSRHSSKASSRFSTYYR